MRSLLKYFTDRAAVHAPVGPVARAPDRGSQSANGAPETRARRPLAELLEDANRDALFGRAYVGRHLEELAVQLADGENSIEKNGDALCFNDEVLLAGARLLNRCRQDVDLAEDVSRILGAPERLSLLEALCSPHDATNLARAQIAVGDDLFLTEQQLDEAVAHLRARAEANPNDWKAQAELGVACLKSTRGFHAERSHRHQLFTCSFQPEEAVEALSRAAALHPGDESVDRLLRSARRHATPPILFVGLPRSASVFVFTSLADGLDKPKISDVMCGAFPDYRLCQGFFHIMLRARGTSHTHLRATRTSLLEISPSFGLDKMMVQVRDPRQALMSWHDWMPKVVSNMDSVQSKHYELPDDYLERTGEAQMDWLVDNWLPVLVTWLQEWREAQALDWFATEILFTKFEDLKRDQTAFFDRILDFYAIDRDLFDPPQPPLGEGDRNFRKGELESWRHQATPAQIERMRTHVPKDLLNYFGWPAF